MNGTKDKLKCMVPISAPNLDELFKNKREADKARAVLQHLFFIGLRMKKDNGFAPGIDRVSRYLPVSASNLKQIVRNYSQIINQLIHHGIIEYRVNEEGNKSYMPGKYTMLYRISHRVLKSTTARKYRMEYITHPSVINAIKRYYMRKYYRQVGSAIHKDCWLASTAEFIDSLYLDVSLEQLGRIDRNDDIDLDYLIGVVGKFNNQLHRFFVRDNFGHRLHTHVSNLPSVLRPFLRVRDNDEPLVIIDVTSAQPYLMGAMFYHNKLIELTKEFEPILPVLQRYQKDPSVRLFLQDCSTGQFYQGLMNASGYSKSELKTSLFEHVFYSSIHPYKSDFEKGTKRWKTQQLFCSKYRGVFELLQELKCTPKSTLPFVSELSKSYVVPNILAQRLESAIFLDGITRQCAEQDISVATIHDAWILNKSDQERFLEVFYDEFKLLGLDPPQVKIKELSATLK